MSDRQRGIVNGFVPDALGGTPARMEKSERAREDAVADEKGRNVEVQEVLAERTEEAELDAQLPVVLQVRCRRAVHFGHSLAVLKKPPDESGVSTW